MSDDGVLDRLTAICEALPEVEVDRDHSEHRGFKVGKKAFAWYMVDGHGETGTVLGVRADPGENEVLIEADGARFKRAKYMHHHGWVEYRLDLAGRPVDWDEVTELVTDSYRLQAPKRLSRLLD
jgi:hypothetical protein